MYQQCFLVCTLSARALTRGNFRLEAARLRPSSPAPYLLVEERRVDSLCVGPLDFEGLHLACISHASLLSSDDEVQACSGCWQTKLAVRDVAQGTSVRELVMMDPKEATKKVAVLKASSFSQVEPCAGPP